MDTPCYYVAKTSDTSADTLLAVGFTMLLSHVLQRLGKASKGTCIQDMGDYYAVTPSSPISEHDLQHLKPFDLIRPLITEKEAKKIEGLDGFDYELQRQLSIAHSTWQRENRGKPRALVGEPPQAPDPLLPEYQAIQQMKIASSFNELVLRWHDLDRHQAEHIHVLLRLFATPLNDIAAAAAACQKLAQEHGVKPKMFGTALQVVNPTTGKGANRPKASTLADGNQESFWLLELLKFVGFMEIAMPCVVQGSKDRKTYVLQPNIIELSTLQHIMRAFRASGFSSTSVKLDILASLRLVQTYVRLRLQALKGEASEDEFMEEEQVYSLVHGLDVTFYKDMRSAYATMNVALLNLPYWLPAIKTLDEAETALAMLEEHLHIIHYIRAMRNGKPEEGAEEYALLRFYRDFLSGRDLRSFWRFTTAYSSYLMSQREHEKNPKRYLRQLSITGLEYLLMTNPSPTHKRLTTITNNEGFRRVAYAIRQATVRAQYRRAQEHDREIARTYEVHYGLGQELMREVKYREKFSVALATFLTQYNAETAREEEKLANKLARALTPEDRRRYKLRSTVAVSDIDQVMALLDDFDAETVGSLLIAYGYASERSPRRDGNGPELEPDNAGPDTPETEDDDTEQQ
jgi:hypothetical protein